MSFFNPDALCKQFEQHYPRAFARIEDARAIAVAHGERWPAWCYVPMRGVQAVMREVYRITQIGELASEAAIATSLAAWRMGGKHVLLFDEIVMRELWDMPVEGDIPTDTLLRLPFWCIYVPVQISASGKANLRGAFIHLEHDANTRRAKLSFVIDLTDEASPGDGLLPMPLNLDVKAPLAEVLRSTLNVDKVIASLPPDQRAAARVHLEHVHAILRPFVSIALYLCADNADVRDPDTGAPAQISLPKPSAKKLFAAPSATTWNVAWRIGAALRRAEDAVRTASGTNPGTGRTVRPHMRKAHWHTYRTGPRATPKLQRLILHWLPPIPVAMPEDVDATQWAELLPTTVRPVDAS